jgi:site-specific DNA recombinase
MTRVFGYVRLSKEDANTTSPQRQRERIERLCADRGWDLAETFSDIDVSAFNGTHRPGYDAMIRRLSEVEAIVFWRLDRLSRSVSDFSKLLDHCQTVGVKLVSTDQPIDTSSAMGKAFVQMTSVFAELEAGTTSERSRQMHAYKKDHGEWVGRVPFGWRLVGKHLERDEDQQAVLLDAARRYVAGESFSAIARGHGMATAVLSRILHSERVHDALPDDLAQLLTDALWRRDWKRSPTSAKSLLGGIVRCAECGETMTASSTRARREGRWFSYGCKATGHVHISAGWLDPHVTERVLEAVDSGRLTEAVKRRRKPRRSRAASMIEARLDNLDAEYAAGKIATERFNRMNAQLLEQLRDAQAEERDSGIDLPAEFARDLSARWADLDVQHKRQVILAVVQRIEVSKATGNGPVDPSRVEIVWRG